MFFSVVVPTCGRPGPLTSCLEALARLEYPCDLYEVIVVDDGSPAPLDAVVGTFRSRVDVTLLRQQNGGPAAARNAGAGRARAGSRRSPTGSRRRQDVSWGGR